MTTGFKTTILGKTGLKVGRLGLAGSYGAPASAFEAAFDKGCNYFYSGSGRKRDALKQAVKNLVFQGKRDQMVISIQTYARWGILTEVLFKQTLKSMHIDHADILMLGWHNHAPCARLMEFALRMKEKGLARFIGISGHNRPLFSQLAQAHEFDLFQIRYNPAHTGAESDCFHPMAQLFERDTSMTPGIVSYTATRWGHLLQAKKMPRGEAPLQASDCYRFALSHPMVNICLCGPADTHQMNHALTALDMGPLTSKEEERIRRIGAHVRQTAKAFWA